MQIWCDGIIVRHTSFFQVPGTMAGTRAQDMAADHVYVMFPNHMCGAEW